MEQIETTSMGTRRHHYVGTKGDLRIELHYAPVHKHCGREACLYIYRARDPKGGMLVPMCMMWEFDTRFTAARNNDISAQKLYGNVQRLAAHLYGFATQSDEHRILDVMCDYLEDLKNHKPETGLDPTLDEWLAELDKQGMEFFLEVNGTRVI